MAYDFTIVEYAQHVVLVPHSDRAYEWFLTHLPRPHDGYIEKTHLNPIVEHLRLDLFSIGHQYAILP
jgi:hypothetical protein